MTSTERKGDSEFELPGDLTETTEKETSRTKGLLRSFLGGLGATAKSHEETGSILDRLHTTSIGDPANPRTPAHLTPQSELDPGSTETTQNSSYIEPSFSSQVIADVNIQQLVNLLRDGKVQEFNALRPSAAFCLAGAQLKNLNLRDADLRGIDFTRANLSGSDLTGALFQRACLDHADLSKTTLNNCQFFGATLRYTDLTSVAEAKQAEFSECNMNCADLSKNSNFSGSVFNGTKLIKANLSESNFNSCQMVGVYLASSTLTNTSFVKSNMHKVRLFQANGLDVNFSEANLSAGEAIQSHFTSSDKKSGDGKSIKTNFDASWIMGFKHNGAIPEAFFENAITDRLPPEGQFVNTHEIDQGKLLINGIPGTDKVLYDSAMEELDALIGLEEVKQQIKELTAFVEANQARIKMDLPAFKCILHRVYLGEPGTGKTTVARIEAKLYYALGLLSKGHVVETDKSGFIAGYAGQSLGKAHETIDSALGGTLIADEIYAMTETKNDDFAKDAMAVIVKRLWDDRDKFCCIFLGYGDEMEEFMNTNKGMKRRIGAVIHFKSYSSGDLIDIFKLKMDKQKFNYTTEMLAEACLLLAIVKQKDGKNFGNAGTVENAVDDLAMRLSSRLKDQGTIKSEEAHRNPLAVDLPFEKITDFERDSFPAVSDLIWVDDAGQSISFDKLSTTGKFPDLSTESVALIKSYVDKAIIKNKSAVN